MPKGFKEAAARSRPVYGTIIGSAQPETQTNDVQDVQEVHSTQGRKGAKQRINMAFSPENLDYMRVMAGLKGISVTRFVNDLIAQDREKNRAAYGTVKSLSEQV